MKRLTERLTINGKDGILVQEEGGYSIFYEEKDEGYMAMSKLADYEDKELRQVVGN